MKRSAKTKTAKKKASKKQAATKKVADWSEYSVTTNFGEQFEACRTCFSIGLWGPPVLRDHAQSIIDRWRELLPEDRGLYWLHRDANHFRPLTTRSSKTLAVKLALADSETQSIIIKRGPEDSLNLHALELSLVPSEACASSAIIAFPTGYPAAEGAERTTALFAELVTSLPIQHGIASYSFTCTPMVEFVYRQSMYELGQRCKGLWVRCRNTEPGLVTRIIGSAWLVFLSSKMRRARGSSPKWHHVEESAVAGGHIFRTSEMPTAGCEGSNIEGLRELDTFLAPIRLQDWFEPHVFGSDSNDWFRRFEIG